MALVEDYDFHVIMPCDVTLPLNYAERMLEEFEKYPNLVMASGDWGSKKTVAPHGGGRFVRQSFFWNYYQDGYVHKMGYESEILDKALSEGFNIKVLNDLEFYHHEELGHGHGFKTWGESMKTMGYLPIFAYGRFIMDFFTNKEVGKMGAIKMWWYYTTFKPHKTGYYSMWPNDVVESVRRRQRKETKRYIRRFVYKLAVMALRKVHKK